MPTVSSKLGGPEHRPTLTLVYEFGAAERPELSSGLEVLIEWRRPGKPPVGERQFSIIKWGRTRVRDPVEGEWPPEDGRSQGVEISMPQRFCQGLLHVQLKWTAAAEGGPVVLEHQHSEVVASRQNQAEVVTEPSQEPQLSAALFVALEAEELDLTRSPAPAPRDETRFVFRGNQVLRILNHLDTRLRSGLGGFWFSEGPQCRDPSGRLALSEVPDAQLPDLSLGQVEEAWAQLITEMVLGTAYNGPGSYLGKAEIPASKEDGSDGWHPTHRRDASFFRLVREQAAQGDYIFSPVHACQQLATAVVMSRSADFHSLADDPIGAGEPKPNGKVDGASREIKNRGLATGEDLFVSGFLAPGACYFLDHSVFPHVAPVVRAFNSKRFQMLDTGAMDISPHPFNFPPTDPPPKDGTRPRAGMNYDTLAVGRMRKALFGALVPPQVPKDKLVAAVILLKQARPLCFFRVVILERGGSGEDSVLWVSQRLHPHTGSGPDYRRFPVAVVLAALRGCPHSDQLEVRWQVFAPVFNPALVHAMKNGRTTRWWEAASATADEDGTVAEKTKFKLVSELTMTDKGVPKVHQRAHQFVPRQPVTLPSFDRLETVTAVDADMRRKFKELADVDNASLPPYFRK